MTDTPQPFIPPPIQMWILMVLAAVGVLALLGGFSVLVYHMGQASVQQSIPTPAPAVTSQPTPAPTPAPAQYPRTITVQVRGISQPPYNMFPELVDYSGRIYDISGTGINPDAIILGGTYDIYITGERQQYGETIYSAGWVVLTGQNYYRPYSTAWNSEDGQPVIYGPNVIESSDSRINYGRPQFHIKRD